MPDESANPIGDDPKILETNCLAAPEGNSQACLNCGHPAPDPFCSHCGQSTRDIRVSFRSLMMDFLGDTLTFDSKLFRTLAPMFFEPGELTAAFMRGQRIRFVPPLRLFIFTSLVFLITVHYAMPINRTSQPLPSEDRTTAEASTTDDSDNDAPPSTNRSDFSFDFGDGEPTNWFSKRIEEAGRRQEARFNELGRQEAVRLFVNQIFRVLSKALLVLLPIFALFLKLIYVRRDPYYLDHLIFAFHYHSFVFCLITLLIWFNLMFDGAFVIVVTVLNALVVPQLYMIISLRRIHQQSLLKTGLKYAIITLLYFAILIPFAGGVTLLALLTA